MLGRGRLPVRADNLAELHRVPAWPQAMEIVKRAERRGAEFLRGAESEHAG